MDMATQIVRSLEDPVADEPEDPNKINLDKNNETKTCC